jgi:hypothetical protein
MKSHKNTAFFYQLTLIAQRSSPPESTETCPLMITVIFTVPITTTRIVGRTICSIQ